METASKTTHSAIIRQSLVKDFLSLCTIPHLPDEAEVSTEAQFVDTPINNRIRIIIAIDGGYTPVSVQEAYPSSSFTFYTFGGLMFEVSDLQALHTQPFIDPEDMAKLRNIQRFPFVLPTENIRLTHCDSLVESVRWSIYDFFSKSQDGEKPFIHALRWLLFQEYNPRILDRSWQLASCPNCHEPKIIINQVTQNQFGCPNCHKTIYLTDVFRLHEAIDNELGAGGILGYLTSLLEQMLLVHLIKTVWEVKKTMLPEILFVKDGPLAFFGQTANMHEPMRLLLNYLAHHPALNEEPGYSNINLVGVEKSGAFVEHAEAIENSLMPGYAFIPGNEYIYKYITPGAGDPTEPFGKTSYYGNKVIFKAQDGNMYVLTLPTPAPSLNPQKDDLSNFSLILHNISQLKCHMYDNALVPIALVNKLVSLSDHPSSKILSVFAKTHVTHF